MNNRHIIGSQEHRINVMNTGITHLHHLIHHVNNNNMYNLGDYIIVESGVPPQVTGTWQTIKGLEEVNIVPETASEDSDNEPYDQPSDDEDNVRAIMRSNNAATPIPTSGLRFGSLTPINRNVIPSGGKRTHKKRRMRSKCSVKKNKTIKKRCKTTRQRVYKKKHL